MAKKAKKAKAKKPAKKFPIVQALKNGLKNIQKSGKVGKKPVKVVQTKTENGGLRIEKDREERNGITRPSVGGICRGIWDACDAMRAATLGSPTVREIKEHATLKGWNLTTTTIQFYQWRAFHGIESRRAKK